MLVDNYLGVQRRKTGEGKRAVIPQWIPSLTDATIEEEEDEEEVIVESEEEVVVESGTEEKLEQPVVREPLAEELGEATIDPGNQEVVRSHAGEDDL